MTSSQCVSRLPLLLALAVSTACFGDDPFTPQINGSMTALVDGVSFTAIATQAVRQSGGVVLGGSDAAGNTIGIGFMDMGIGPYEILDPDLTNASYTSGGTAWTANASQGSGTIVITALTDTNVAGTFTLTLVGTGGPVSAERQITSGAFNIEF